MSAEEPTLPMDWVTPAARQASAKARELYWVPWSLWKIAPARLPRVRCAACSELPPIARTPDLR